MTKRNEYQRQDINQLKSANKILEEQINVKNVVQISEGNSQRKEREKEKGEKNDQNKGIKTLKKKIGINFAN